MGRAWNQAEFLHPVSGARSFVIQSRHYCCHPFRAELTPTRGWNSMNHMFLSGTSPKNNWGTGGWGRKMKRKLLLVTTWTHSCIFFFDSCDLHFKWNVHSRNKPTCKLYMFLTPMLKEEQKHVVAMFLILWWLQLLWHDFWYLLPWGYPCVAVSSKATKWAPSHHFGCW